MSIKFLSNEELEKMSFMERIEYFSNFADISLWDDENDIEKNILNACDENDYTMAIDYLHAVEYHVIFYSYFYFSFGDGIPYCSDTSAEILYRCAEYYEKKKDKKAADKAWLLFFLTTYPYDPLDDENFPDMKKHFNVVYKNAYPDWCCLFPRTLRLIAEYYESNEDYTKALRYYRKITKLNYEGRQSAEPFAYAARAYSKIADYYENGLGVEKDEKKASYYRMKGEW